MDREQEVIHKQMEETRSDLTNKLAALESQVGGTVQAATNAVESTKDAVTDTVESVKETVENVTEKLHDTVEGVTESVQHAVEGVKESFDETVKTVSEAFNLRLQAERHPWLVFGGAVAAGCVGGLLLGGSSRSSQSSGGSSGFFGSGSESKATDSVTRAAPERAHDADESGGVGGWLWEQLGGLKGLAVGAMMGVVRDLVTQAVPETVKERVTDEVNKLTKSLGGEPLKVSLLGGEAREEPQQGQGNAREFHDNAGSMGHSEGNAARSGKPALATSRR